MERQLNSNASIRSEGDSAGGSADELLEVRHKPAETIFALILLVISLLLLLSFGEQTSSVKGKDFIHQPGFWPALSLGGMILFSTIYAAECWRRDLRGNREAVVAELLVWFKVLEYPLWFLCYVWLVPYFGYLPSTIFLALLLAIRLGYHSRKMLSISLGGAISVVVLFKTFLSVKIPGGELYEFFPESIRNFMILNF